VFSLSTHRQYELYKRSFVLRALPDKAYWLYFLYFQITVPYCSLLFLCLCTLFTLCFTMMAFVCHVFYAIKGLLTYLLNVVVDEDVMPEPRSNSSNCGLPAISPQVSLARIVGGIEARRHSWPWQCSIRLTIGSVVYHICGASVLDSRYVVSAAHCV